MIKMTKIIIFLVRYIYYIKNNKLQTIYFQNKTQFLLLLKKRPLHNYDIE